MRCGVSMKRLVVVSDLHVGNGGDYDIHGGKLGELGTFLKRFAGAGTTIVCNGDSFDFLMNTDAIDEMKVAVAVEQAKAIVSAPVTKSALNALGAHLASG